MDRDLSRGLELSQEGRISKPLRVVKRNLKAPETHPSQPLRSDRVQIMGRYHAVGHGGGMKCSQAGLPCLKMLLHSCDYYTRGDALRAGIEHVKLDNDVYCYVC